MTKIINQLNRRVDHQTCRSLSDRAAIVPKCRPSTFGLLLIFSLLTIQSCGLDIEDPTPPSPPVWVQKSLPEEWPERGIDAHESGGIFHEWLQNPPEENVQNYLLYFAEYFDSQDSIGDYELLSSLESGTQSVIEFIHRSPTVQSRYYYILIAEDASGNLSLPSDTLSYLRFSAVDPASMQPNGLATPLNSMRKLQWGYTTTVAMENYVMTILDIENNLVLRQELVPGNYVGGPEYFTIPDTITLQSEHVYKWRIDMGAQYLDGRETAGAESLWAIFLYNAQ